MGKYIGESVLRKEDPRLVTGEAKYLEDIPVSYTHLTLPTNSRV